MGQLFGTDGVRGVAGQDLDAVLATSVAAAGAQVLSASAGGGTAPGERAGVSRERPLAVIGRDPRASGEFLEAAVIAGLAQSGTDVLRLGVIPTPGVSFLTDALAADFGVVLSASHNPAGDNGIKFFARGGLKLPDAVEEQIEARIRMPERGAVPSAGFGRVSDATDQAELYLAHLLGSLKTGPGSGTAPLTGLRVVVDCAHGAAYQIGPRLLRDAGADVIAIGIEPDGLNINSGCGSTSLGGLRAAVVSEGADAGIAYDGDADRCMAVDAQGRVVDGDQILAILAVALKETRQLAGSTVVATVMANLGFRRAMRMHGIEVVETPVGDRHLIAAMLDGKYVLGGEQSGHIIMLEHGNTGDGVLTSLQLLATMAATGRPLSGLAAVMDRYPQVLVNVHGVDKAVAVGSRELAGAMAKARAELGDTGRVLVRPSGTEPAVRVMVEAVDSGQAERIAEHLASVVRRSGGAAVGTY